MKLLRILALLLWLIPSIAGASVISDAAAALAPGSWVQINTTGISNLHDNVSGGTQHVLTYIDGIHWDPVRRRGLALTSDDPGDRYLVVIDEPTNTWSRTLISNGRSHQYDSFSCDLVERVCVSVSGDGGASWSINMDTLVMTSRGAVPTGFSDAEGGSWNADRGGFYLNDAGCLHRFDTVTFTWAQNVACVPSGTTTYHSVSEYNPMRHITVFGGGTNATGRNIYHMNAAGTITRKNDAHTDVGALEAPRSEFVYEPVTGNFLLLRSNGKLWEYNPQADTWTDITVASGVPSQLFLTSDSNQLNAVAMPIPAYGVIFWAQCQFQTCTTWLYKHAKSQWTPIPYQYDEEATYKRWGWAYTSGDKPAIGSQSGFSVVNPDNHNGVEGDDSWTNMMMYLRTGQAGYLVRTTAWINYLKNDYLQCVGSGETYCFDGGYLYDHLYGWGLLLYYEQTGDAGALTAARNIAAEVETRAASMTAGSTAACYYDCRRNARHTIMAARMANAEPIPRWIALRNKMCDVLRLSPDWDSRGMYFSSQEATDALYGTGAYAGGRRTISSFQIGTMAEALWLCLEANPTSALKDRIVAMATYVKNNGLEPTYQYTGSRIGFQGATPWWNYDFASFVDSVYTIALCDVQVMGYKLTGDISYYNSAVVFYNRGSKGPIGGGLPGTRTAPDNEVYKFIDAEVESDNFFFKWNKGALQYAGRLFENQGNPTIISIAETSGGPLHKSRRDRGMRLGR